MKKAILIISLIILLVSCKEELEIEGHPENQYGVIFENYTNGQLYIQSHQLVMGMPEIYPGESTDPIYGNTPNVSITYFGEGTHFQKIEKEIILTKDKISTIRLEYPPVS